MRKGRRDKEFNRFVESRRAAVARLSRDRSDFTINTSHNLPPDEPTS
jgi:hypothetical protein